MTFERRIVVGLEDIRAVMLQCDHCVYRVSMSPDELRLFPDGCPNGHKWKIGEEGEKSGGPAFRKFGNSLADLRTLLASKLLGFRILLEFDEPR